MQNTKMNCELCQLLDIPLLMCPNGYLNHSTSYGCVNVSQGKSPTTEFQCLDDPQQDEATEEKIELDEYKPDTFLGFSILNEMCQRSSTPIKILKVKPRNPFQISKVPTNERPYACPIKRCVQRFTFRNSLERWDIYCF